MTTFFCVRIFQQRIQKRKTSYSLGVTASLHCTKMWPGGSSCLYCMALGLPSGAASPCGRMGQETLPPAAQTPLPRWQGEVVPTFLLPTCTRWFSGAAWCFTLLAHPQSPAIVSTLPHALCAGATSDPCSIPSRALRSVPVPAPSSPIPYRAHTRPPAAPLAFTLISRGGHAGTNTSAEDRAGQKGHGQRGEANRVTICQEVAWERNPDSGCPVAGTVRPPSVHTALKGEPLRTAGTLPSQNPVWTKWEFHLEHGSVCTVSGLPTSQIRASEEKQHLLPGETAAPVRPAQPGGASVLEILVWRNEQPNSTDMSAFNYSWSVVQIFPFLSCVLLPKTQKPAKVQESYPSKIIITLQPYYYN